MSATGTTRLTKKTSSQKAPRSTSSSKSAQKDSNCTCPICEDVILDDTVTQTGQDSIFCEGACSTWLHRGCAGLSKKRFLQLNQSDKSFLCTSCCLLSHSSEIKDLRDSINHLTQELLSLKSLVSSRRSDGQHQSPTTDHQAELSCNDPTSSPTLLNNQSVNSNSPLPSRNEILRSDQVTDINRKLNIIVSGIPECKNGLHYKQRFASDLNNVSTLFHKSHLKTPPMAIKDCRRLGKFSPDHKRPRPILVRFNSCSVVMEILSNCSSFAPYIIKPDLSPKDRIREKILLKERWILYQSGVDKSTIKIKGNAIMVSDQIHGKVNNDLVFSRSASEAASPVSNSSPTSDLPADVSTQKGSPIVECSVQSPVSASDEGD